MSAPARQIYKWLNARTMRLWAADCAEHVLPRWTAVYPDDQRPAEAIEAARRSARGELTANELETAWRAAAQAASGPIYSAAADAAYTASNAASNAACDARAARNAALAACNAAYSLEAKERHWQSSRLLDYIEGRAT